MQWILTQIQNPTPSQIETGKYFDIAALFSDSALDIDELHANLWSLLFVELVTERRRWLSKKD